MKILRSAAVKRIEMLETFFRIMHWRYKQFQQCWKIVKSDEVRLVTRNRENFTGFDWDFENSKMNSQNYFHRTRRIDISRDRQFSDVSFPLPGITKFFFNIINFFFFVSVDGIRNTFSDFPGIGGDLRTFKLAETDKNVTKHLRFVRRITVRTGGIVFWILFTRSFGDDNLSSGITIINNTTGLRCRGWDEYSHERVIIIESSIGLSRCRSPVCMVWLIL